MLFSSKVVAVHIVALVLTTIVYRLSPFHPLWRFPGPVINRITSLYNAYKTYTGERHLYVDELHRRYGRIVRIGPDALSINSFSAVSQVYSSTNAMTKGRAYTYGGAHGSGLFFMKSRAEHSKRRKIWAPAFAQSNLPTFRQAIHRRTFQLMQVIQERCDTRGVVNLGEAIGHWTYDIMGDVTFGASSQVELLENGDSEGLIRSGQLATTAFEIIGEVPLLFSILWYFPVTKKMRALEERAGRWMTARQNAPDQDKQNDIASFLLVKDGSKPKLTHADLRVDSLFAIQAGSDTPAGVLTLMFFFLIKDSQVYDALRNELDMAFPDATVPLNMHALGQLEYLSAFMTESLRLGAPFHGFPRITPNEGAFLDEWFVPGGITVSVPGWSQHIDEDNFYPEPLAFRPQRWLPGGLGTGSRANKAAIMAFSSGPYSCLGKQFAMEEITISLVRIVLTYDLEFAPEFDADSFYAGALNVRTPVFKRPLNVVAKRRCAQPGEAQRYI
ncbi:cytochrome P450 [Vararia minispora EC-137]|uniref:Cytochrome P450 n=1 Tax=Vararia minispora EC-137 TaxID=1314806 RepID=A0ACB8QF78_9AGAM|nr:cytochrome P450 [Vararia minispora EC-137]